MYKNKKDFDLFLNFVNNISIIPTTSMFSIESAKIKGHLKNKGITLCSNDLLIAGMMKCFGISKLVTKNKKHFSKIPGIKVISY